MKALRLMLSGGLLALLLLPLAALADLPAAEDFYVNDFADVLTLEEEAELRGRLTDLREETRIHGVVATLRSPIDYDGPTGLAAFATALFNHWGIGDRIRNDGFLILVATDTREIRIELGAGYEPVWDNRAQRVIDALMVPLLRDERYAEGLEAGVSGVADYIARPLSQGVSFTATEGMPDAPEENENDLVTFLTFMALIGGMVLYSNRAELGDALARHRPCPQCRARTIRTKAGRRPGEEVLSMRRFCSSCGWETWRALPDAGSGDQSSDRGSSSGGGGGFGGGSSSGGGASGRY